MAISKSESTKRVKLNLKGLTPEEKSRAKELAGSVIVDGINEFLDKSQSPVQGGSFARRKKDNTLSRLFEDGDMRSQITFEELESDHVEVGIFEAAPEIERLKSFNHNVGDTLPKRQFIAAPNRKFNTKIMEDVNSALSEVKEQARINKEQEDDLVRTILSPEDLSDLLG